MNNHIIRCVALALVVFALAACGDDLKPTQPQDPKSTPMTFVVDYPGQTRATATDFELGDRIGLYVADAKEPLELAGNLVKADTRRATFSSPQPRTSRLLIRP